jgi:hypothetical protein
MSEEPVVTYELDGEIAWWASTVRTSATASIRT